MSLIQYISTITSIAALNDVTFQEATAMFLSNIEKVANGQTPEFKSPDVEYDSLVSNFDSLSDSVSELFRYMDETQ